MDSRLLHIGPETRSKKIICFHTLIANTIERVFNVAIGERHGGNSSIQIDMKKPIDSRMNARNTVVANWQICRDDPNLQRQT